jgi:hypothetical protein
MALANLLGAPKGAGRGAGRLDLTDPDILKGARATPVQPPRTVPAPSAPPPAPGRAVPAPSPPPGKAVEAPAGPAVMNATQMTTLGPLVLSAMPGLFLGPTSKSTTQIAQGALRQLTSAAPAVVQEAVRIITNKRVTAGQLLNYLERKTRVGEVLNDLAQDWDEPTPQDFAEAFQMPATADKFPVMDTIVSIAILNDPDLRSELEDENTTEPSQADLMENRRIVWQWPEPGTPFTPPYVMMVAVEREDARQAQNIIQSILGDLVDFQGYKIPRETMRKL